MSIDTTFKPVTGLLVVDNTVAQQLPNAGQLGVTTFRCVPRVASGYLTWGATAASIAAPTAPAAVGYQKNNTIGLNVIGVPVYIEVPPNSFFISDKAFAAGNVEITGGIGGVGG